MRVWLALYGRELVAALVLGLTIFSCTLVTSGCAALMAALPDVIAAVIDGGHILDAIEAFLVGQHPSAEDQKKISEAIGKARTALNAALRTAQGTQDLSDEKIDHAFDEFKVAYMELMSLVRPYGVRMATLPSARFATSREGLQVPEPMAFHPNRKVFR